MTHAKFDYLRISFLTEKSTLFAEVCQCDVGCHLSFGMDMSAWSWDAPLVLGKKLPAEEAIRLLKKVRVDGENPGSIHEVEEFCFISGGKTQKS